jgi:hypothetical protein
MSNDQTELITVREFLESVPPGQQKRVKDVKGGPFSPQSRQNGAFMRGPDLSLFCETKGKCGKMQMFKTADTPALGYGDSRLAFVKYTCRNCDENTKVFALWVTLNEDGSGSIYKYGELPQFGPPNSPKLISLLEENKDLFLKGRRAENQSMGIAAFAYYRRIIETQKGRILDEIIRVCKAYAASADVLAELEAAKKETRFTSVIEVVKHGLPDVLFINGHNPLTLLHDALSEGLHAETDEECLEVATDIRTVMGALAERMAEALREQKDLSQSVSRLLKKRAERNQKAASLPAAAASSPARAE